MSLVKIIKDATVAGLFSASLLACFGDTKRPHGTCETPEEVNFRGYHFRFPITGERAMQETDGELISYGGSFFRKIAPADGQEIYWFTDPHNENILNARDTAAYLQQVKMFGVAFSAKGMFDVSFSAKGENNSKPGKEQILAELNKTFSGEFTYKNIVDRHYYIQDRGCLKILCFFYFNGPSIAFLYGLDDDLVDQFVQYPYFLYRTFH